VTSSPSPATEIDPARVPTHVAWVAAGSERWASAHAATAEVLAGAEDRALAELVDAALELGIRWLTVQDPSSVRRYRRWGGADLAARGVALRLLGSQGLATPRIPGLLSPGSPTALTLTIADGYSGRGEIVGAVRALAAAGAMPDQIDERSISASLYAPDAPDPDLLVQTGGDRRVPDLLLWEVAYSELVFLDEPWPDVRRAHVRGAVAEYQRRDRRYGGLVTSGHER
jgi:undecaprenyl diphosphate synthase